MYKMISQRAARAASLPEGTPASPTSGDPIDNSVDQPEDMQYIAEFVAGLDHKEFAYLQEQIEERLRGEDEDSGLKTADEVADDYAAEAEMKGATENNSRT